MGQDVVSCTLTVLDVACTTLINPPKSILLILTCPVSEDACLHSVLLKFYFCKKLNINIFLPYGKSLYYKGLITYETQHKPILAHVTPSQ